MFILASAAMISAAACTQIQMNGTPGPFEIAHPGMGTIVVNISQGSPSTRAESVYEEEKDYEMALNKVEILVFDKENGELNGYMNAGNATEATMNVTAGAKNVYAVANSPSDLSVIRDESSLKKIAIRLEDNHTDKTQGFVMAGMTDATVTSGATTSPTVRIDRFTSRIALVKVTNNLPAAYGALVIEDVFLTNVAANQNLNGDAEYSDWYNIKGRIKDAAKEDDIIGIGENKGTFPELTQMIPENLSIPNSNNGTVTENYATPEYLFYAYPNSCEAAGEKVLWNTKPFPGDQTRLVLTATVDGKYFYYPVIIDRLERNKSYDVSVKISGFGVSDPDDEIMKGSLQFTVEANEWVMGDAILGDL